MVQIPDIVRDLISNGGFPTKHLSYSSLKEYLGNPRSFLKKYIRYEFDDQTKAVFMVGKAVHKALEEYFKIYQTGEIVDIDKAYLFGLDHFRRELLETRAKSLTKWIKGNGGEFEYPIFTKTLTNEEIAEFYENASLLARQYVAIPPDEDTPEKEEAYITSFLKDFVEYSLLTTGAKTVEEVIADSEEQIKTAITNFFDSEWTPEGVVHSTEREEVVFFQDEVGEEMPIPVKAIIDRVDIINDEKGNAKYCIVTDYKTTDKFSLTDSDKADYEMQAGTNYFTALVATGVIPKKMRFVEILKKSPGYILPEDPEKRLLKGDLVELVKTRMVGYMLTGKELVDDLKKILIDGGILEREKAVNIFEIDFEERPDIILTFLAMYKGILIMVALSEMFGVYLPNISAQWGGLEAWQDFKEFEGTPRDRTPKIQTLEAPVVENVVTDDLADIESL